MAINTRIEQQKRMDAVFDNYLKLTPVLRDDLNFLLLKDERKSQAWRRNFIRASAALFEGHAHCLQGICRAAFECGGEQPSTLTEKEKEVFYCERGFSAKERIRLTLSAVSKYLEPVFKPDFAASGWPDAQKVFDKRDQLMHPKNKTAMDVFGDDWDQLHAGVVWLVEQFFAVQAAWCERFLPSTSASVGGLAQAPHP